MHDRFYLFQLDSPSFAVELWFGNRYVYNVDIPSYLFKHQRRPPHVIGRTYQYNTIKILIFQNLVCIFDVFRFSPVKRKDQNI